MLRRCATATAVEEKERVTAPAAVKEGDGWRDVLQRVKEAAPARQARATPVLGLELPHGGAGAVSS